jgi:hypothetical protein
LSSAFAAFLGAAFLDLEAVFLAVVFLAAIISVLLVNLVCFQERLVSHAFRLLQDERADFSFSPREIFISQEKS